MEIQPQAKTMLVYIEEPSKPSAKERNHAGIRVAEQHLAIGLRALARVERRPGDEELPLGEPADPVAALGQQALDLGCLASLERVRRAPPGCREEPRLKGHVPRPQR